MLLGQETGCTGGYLGKGLAVLGQDTGCAGGYLGKELGVLGQGTGGYDVILTTL